MRAASQFFRVSVVLWAVQLPALRAQNPEESLRAAICEFFDKPGGETCTQAARQRIEVLFATVPDPEKSHLGLYFDRTVESVQRAAGDLQYVFDRYWLPWGDQDKNKENSDAGRPQGMPGVLLFRHDSEKPLAVFLIGETPTSGIDRSAFLRALDYVPDGARLRIIGPNFSGSLPSLVWLSRRAAARNIRFRVISGGATALKSGADFRAQIQAVGGEYDAVLHNDVCARTAFLDYIRQEWHDDGRAAILSEDETPYGQQARPADSPVLTIRFPRQISRLRNTYQEDPELSGGAKGGVPRQFLMLKLKDVQAGTDSVPYFAKDQTPLSQEAVMSSIASTLERERIKVAGIVATDILDAMFISWYLRRTCPDLRLFLLDSDLLLVEASNTLPFEGILAVTTYPLFSRNQAWVSPPDNGGQRMIFASRYAEGTYNAFRAQILERRGQGVPPPLVEYAAAGGQGGGKPPIWLTVVSRTGFWPVAMLGDPQQTDPLLLPWSAPSNPGNPIPAEHPSRFWVFLFWTYTTLCVAYAAALACAQWSRARWLAPWSARPREPGAPSRAFYLLCGALALEYGYSLLACTAIRVWMEPGQPREWAAPYPAVAAGTLGLLALAALTPFAGIGRRALFRRTGIAYLGASLAVCGLCGVFVGLGWSALAQQAYGQGFFSAYRSLDLASGVSPVPPLLFLAAALWSWAWAHLRRITSHADMRPVLPRITFFRAAGLMSELERRVDAGLSRVVFHPAELCFLAIVAGAGALSLGPGDKLRSFENFRYNWLFLLALTLVCSLVFLAWARFLYVWSGLRSLLEELERHPLRDVFSSLGPDYSWSLVWQPGGMRGAYDLLVKSVECAWEYAGSAGRREPDLRKECAALQTAVGTLLATAAHRQRATVFALNRAQWRAASLGDEFLAELDAIRWGADESVAVAAVAAGGAARGVAVQRERPPEFAAASKFVALRFVEYIRYVLLQLRGLLSFVTAGFILCLLALNSYPFQSEYLAGWAATGIFLALGGGVVLAFAQMHRDAILSRITSTPTGKLGKGFYLRVASFGALPLLTVVASQFPAAGRFLFSWVQPTLEALR
jgi:hypothetical protein